MFTITRARLLLNTSSTDEAKWLQKHLRILYLDDEHVFKNRKHISRRYDGTRTILVEFFGQVINHLSSVFFCRGE